MLQFINFPSKIRFKFAQNPASWFATGGGFCTKSFHHSTNHLYFYFHFSANNFHFTTTFFSAPIIFNSIYYTVLLIFNSAPIIFTSAPIIFLCAPIIFTNNFDKMVVLSTHALSTECFGLFETTTVTQCPPLYQRWTNNLSTS